MSPLDDPKPAPAGPAIVQFQGIEKSWAGVPCLENLDLEVAPREKLAIIGPSGSGKTTILRLLMGLERPTSGKILLGGDVVWDEPGKLDEKRVRAARERLGFVFQHFNLFPHMTALRNVASGPLYAHKVAAREAEERARELLTRVGLERQADKYPAQLSGGQQQRVAIARALAMQPDVMLFDEPTSALDPELVGEVLQVIVDLAEHTSVTMMLVTHEMNFARQIADRVAFCDGGRVVESGPPEKLFTDPEHERTRDFLKAVLEPI